MLQRLLHALVLYLLQKSVFERIVLFSILTACCFIILSYVEHDEWVVVKRKQVGIATIQNDIAILFEDYNIQSKCTKIICTNKEVKQKHIQTKLPYTQHYYTLFFTCNGLLCYEFIRSLEALPTLFIHEVSSSNATIMQNSPTQPKTTYAIPSFSQSDNIANEFNMQWTQDMHIVFSIGTYQI